MARSLSRRDGTYLRADSGSSGIDGPRRVLPWRDLQARPGQDPVYGIRAGGVDDCTRATT